MSAVNRKGGFILPDALICMAILLALSALISLSYGSLRKYLDNQERAHEEISADFEYIFESQKGCVICVIEEGDRSVYPD